MSTIDSMKCGTCSFHIHSSNKKIQCMICLNWHHAVCVGMCETGLYCIHCITDELPFVSISDADFANEYGAFYFKFDAAKTLKFNMDPLENDNNFISNPEIDPDVNHYNFVFNNILDYSDSNQLNKILNNVNSVNLQSILYLNAQNLYSHQDIFYANMKCVQHKFSVLAFCETHTDTSTETSIEIPGYNKLIKSRIGRRGGGVALFFDSDINIGVKRRNDLECTDDSIMESMFVQITQHGLSVKDVIIGVIYRPPNTNVQLFLDKLICMLDKINNDGRPSYLLGDFNINLFNNSANYSQRFLNTFLSAGFYPRIDRPTRISDHSATLIDNIFTNTHDCDIKSGIWLADISDHLPMFITLPYDFAKKHKTSPTFVYKRVYSQDSLDGFKQALSAMNWSHIFTEEANANNKYNVFISTIKIIHDKYFPFVKKKINSQINKKPWITNNILKCIKKKNNLYKQTLKTNSDLLLSKYKIYKNKLISILRAAEKTFYADKLMQIKDSTSKTWKLLNEITHRGSTRANRQIDIDGVATDDSLTIANKFNRFFTNIGPELAKKIPSTGKNPISLLEGNFSDSMFFSPVLDLEVFDIIHNF